MLLIIFMRFGLGFQQQNQHKAGYFITHTHKHFIAQIVQYKLTNHVIFFLFITQCNMFLILYLYYDTHKRRFIVTYIHHIAIILDIFGTLNKYVYMVKHYVCAALYMISLLYLHINVRINIFQFVNKYFYEITT